MVDKIRYFLIFIVVFFGGLSYGMGQVFENYDSSIKIQEEKKWLASPSIAKVEVNVDDFPLLDMAITLPANSSVFVEGKMWFFSEADTSFTIPIQQLKNRFPSTKSSRELVIYKPDIRIKEISIKKGIFEEKLIPHAKPGSFEIPKVRDSQIMERFFIVAVLIIFSLISLFKVIYPLVISFITRPVFGFSTEDFFESNSITKFFSEEILFFLLIFNMLLMLLFMLSAHYLDRMGLESFLMGGLNHMFLVWLSGTGILLVLTLIRFVWLKITAIVFGVNKFEFTHFFFMLRIASVIMVIIYSILIVSMTNDVSGMNDLVNYLWMTFFTVYILGILTLYFIMTKKLSFTNYHLFSYLCTAELVPFLVLSKLIIG